MRKDTGKVAVEDQNEQNQMVHAFRKLSATDNTQTYPQGDHFTTYGFLSPTLQFIASPLTTAANMPNTSTVFPYPEYQPVSQGQPAKPTYTQLLG